VHDLGNRLTIIQTCVNTGEILQPASTYNIHRVRYSLRYIGKSYGVHIRWMRHTHAASPCCHELLLSSENT